MHICFVTETTPLIGILYLSDDCVLGPGVANIVIIQVGGSGTPSLLPNRSIRSFNSYKSNIRRKRKIKSKKGNVHFGMKK